MQTAETPPLGERSLNIPSFLQEKLRDQSVIESRASLIVADKENPRKSFDKEEFAEKEANSSKISFYNAL